jgi:hypothetical protein
VSFESAETMLDKAIDLLAGAQALHGDGNDHDHAAILLAIHSGITAPTPSTSSTVNRSPESIGRLRSISGGGTPNDSQTLRGGYVISLT